MKNTDHWKFNKRSLTLTFIGQPQTRSGEGYFIDLKDCGTSAGMLECIFQASAHYWATADVCKSLNDKLFSFFNPLCTLCPEGKERGPIDVKKVLRDNKAIE